MKTTLLAGIASLALVIPAVAQTTTSPGQSQPQTTPPSMNRSTGTGTTDTTTSTGRPAVQSPSTAQSPSTTTTTTTPSVTQSTTTTTTPGASGTQMTYMNALMPGHFMASNLMDRTVYGADGNSVGDINDVIIDRNGNIAAVVIGVGGFLGIGEKDVAVPFNRLQVMSRDQARAPGGNTGASGNTAPGSSGMSGSSTTTTGTNTSTTGTSGMAGGSSGMTGGDGFWANFNEESRLVLSATRDELRNAPTFRENAQGGTARTGTGTGGTTTTPNTTTPGGTPTR